MRTVLAHLNIQFHDDDPRTSEELCQLVRDRVVLTSGDETDTRPLNTRSMEAVLVEEV